MAFLNIYIALIYHCLAILQFTRFCGISTFLRNLVLVSDKGTNMAYFCQVHEVVKNIYYM